jgi:hypothetical protein
MNYFGPTLLVVDMGAQHFMASGLRLPGYRPCYNCTVVTLLDQPPQTLRWAGTLWRQEQTPMVRKSSAELF